jgi:hypothetical protein
VDYVVTFWSDIFAGMGRACSKCEGEERFTQCFGRGI